MFVLPNSNSQSARENTQRFSATIPCVFVFAVGLLICIGIYIKYQHNINTLKEEYSQSIDTQAKALTERVEMQFKILYQGLKTIARLPRIKEIHSNNHAQLALARRDTQEIYNLLFSFTNLSEIYILPKDFDPDKADPANGKPYEPTFTLDEHIVGQSADNLHNATANSVVEEIEIYEYREMSQHLQWLHSHAKYEPTDSNPIYPAILSREVVTCDNSRFSVSDRNDDRRKGVVYSMPIYNSQGELSGTVVGVFLTDVLRDVLPPDNFVLHNAAYNFKIAHIGNNEWLQSEKWINNGEANPDLIFSDTYNLTFPDVAGNWQLWVGSSDNEFWQLPQVLSTKRFSIMSLLATLLLTVSLGIIITLQIKQRRFAEGQNAVLEYKVLQRSNELAEKKKKLIERTLKLEESETRARAVLDNAAEGIITIDTQGHIDTFNKAAELTFGFNATEIIGKHIGYLLPSLSGKLPQQYMDKYKGLSDADGLSRQHELLGVHNDGSTFAAELHLSKLTFGDTQLFTCIIRDISANKSAEHAIKLAKDSAEQSSRTKSEFLANMSHELRTPLNAIIGYCELLKEESHINENQQHITDLDNIHLSGKHLLLLINSILDLSKIEAGKMELHFDDFNIHTIIEDAVINIQPMAIKNDNKIELDISPSLGPMHADATKLQQIVLNLLSNANKFTLSGKIIIEANVIYIHGLQWLNLTVCDTGVGMSDQQLEKLFQEFTQGDSSTTKRYGGTGLGMAICQQFCEMMGGNISVQSELDVGSKFTVQLPMAVIGPNVDPKTIRFCDNRSQIAKTRQKISRVLIVSHDKQTMELIESFLIRDGFYAETANNFPLALNLAKHNSPDVIVVDENSVDLDGWSAINSIKQLPDIDQVPIIMLSKSESRELATTMGVNDFLAKPIQRNRLLDVVIKYVRKQTNDRYSDNYVLVVEDDYKNRDVLRRHLEAEGIHVKLAENGLEGIALIKEKIPDLIFLDIIMPELDGFEFIDQLRNTANWGSIPVVILTAIELSEEQRNRLSNHVETIIVKSDVEPSTLLARLHGIIIDHLKLDRTGR